MLYLGIKSKQDYRLNRWMLPRIITMILTWKLETGARYSVLLWLSMVPNNI